MGIKRIFVVEIFSILRDMMKGDFIFSIALYELNVTGQAYRHPHHATGTGMRYIAGGSEESGFA